MWKGIAIVKVIPYLCNVLLSPPLAVEGGGGGFYVKKCDTLIGHLFKNTQPKILPASGI
jgi:hypothetical protein